MDNKQHIDQFFKRVVEHYDLKPSNDVWNRIEEELNTGNTQHTKLPIMRYAAIFMAFLTLSLVTLPLSNYNFLSNNPVAFNPTAPIPSSVLIEPATISIDNTKSPKIATAAIAILPSTRNISSNALEINTIALSNIGFSRGKKSIIAPVVETDKQLMANESVSIIERVFNNDKSIESLGFKTFVDDEDHVSSKPAYTAKIKDLDKSGLYIGAAASYNQTSLLEYGNVFKGERPIQPSLKFGTSKSALVGYNFNNKIGIEAGYIYNAALGQNYVMSEENEIVEKSLSLTYDLIPVVAKIKVGKVSDVTNLPVVLNYVAGVQYGILKEARLPQDKRYDAAAEEVFKQTDLSVVLGLEYEVYMQDNIILTMGARGSFSNDISTHIEPLNDYAKRNFVFGLRASVSYLLN